MSMVASFGREVDRSHRAQCQQPRNGLVAAVHGNVTTIALPLGSVIAPPTWIARVGPLIVIADARIDDRASLIDRLGLDARTPLDAPALIANAWARWGEEAADRLVGDFAFVVVDQARGTVHLVRDFMSRRPLHYRAAAGRLSIASRPSVLADETDAVAIEAVARHLALFPQTGSESFFNGVDRVEPGTIVRWRDGHTTITSYWHAPKPVRHIGRDEATETAAALLLTAARDRLSIDPSGGALQLSGGMDSSIVAAVVGQAGLGARAISAVAAPGADPPPAGFLPEDGVLALDTASRYPALTAQCCLAAPRPWQALLEDWNAALDQPLRNYDNIDWIDSTAATAARGGAATLLTADFGNDSLSHEGTAILAEQLRHGRWRSLAYSARALRRATGARWRGVAAYALGSRVPAPIWRHLAGVPSPLQAVASAGMLRPDHPLVAELVARAAADRHDLAERPPASCWAVRSRMVGWVDTGLLTDAIRRRHGVTLADPTADRRLVEFTLSLPAEHWFVDGRPRSFARTMLAGRVSDAVVNPVGRGLQGCDWRQSAEPSLPWLREEVERLRTTALGEILDLPRMARLLDRWPTDGWSSPAQLMTYRYALLRAISMGHFARTRDRSAPS